MVIWRHKSKERSRKDYKLLLNWVTIHEIPAALHLLTPVKVKVQQNTKKPERYLSLPYCAVSMVCLGNRFGKDKTVLCRIFCRETALIWVLNCSFHYDCLGVIKNKIRQLKSERKTFTSKLYCIILVVKWISMYAHARYTFCTKSSIYNNIDIGMNEYCFLFHRCTSFHVTTSAPKE